jgi:hypothetical protein
VSLRDEFEPRLISWFGFHPTADTCRRAWNSPAAHDEPRIKDEIARATEWLEQWTPTKTINRKAGSSYGIKHIAERWHEVRTPAANCYIGNGSLLMAAVRMGFPATPTGMWSGDAREFSNGWLGLPRAAGEFPKVIYDSRTGRAWFEKDLNRLPPRLRLRALL